jgi:hypothetical protein
MDTTTLIAALVQTANELDTLGMGAEADTVTRVAASLSSNNTRTAQFMGAPDSDLPNLGADDDDPQQIETQIAALHQQMSQMNAEGDSAGAAEAEQMILELENRLYGMNGSDDSGLDGGGLDDLSGDDLGDLGDDDGGLY